MVQRWKILLFGFALAITPIVGCATASAQGERVYVRIGAPPPPRKEVIVARPGPDYVYIRGHWGYNGGKYEWAPGRWDRPDQPHHRWAEGHWAHDRNGWYWIEGHWH